MKYNNARLMLCDICQARYRHPLPEGWTVTGYRVGTGQYAMIHRGNCPAGFVKVEIDEPEPQP